MEQRSLKQLLFSVHKIIAISSSIRIFFAVSVIFLAEANLLFLESPVGVGFSYTNTSSDLTKLDDAFVGNFQ